MSFFVPGAMGFLLGVSSWSKSYFLPMFYRYVAQIELFPNIKDYPDDIRSYPFQI